MRMGGCDETHPLFRRGRENRIIFAEDDAGGGATTIYRDGR
jgi:hypothetical protein